MTGNVAWDILILVVTVAVAAATAVGYVVWKFLTLVHEQRLEYEKKLSEQRHTLKGGYEQADMYLREMVEDTESKLEARITAVELFNATALAVLDEMKSFRHEVKQRFEDLHRERREDMSLLHQKIEAIRDR